MMHRLRDDFDTIVLDTGPLLGSLDASLGVSAGDDALLVVGRGQRPGLVRAALDRLKTLGGGRVNVVFNRARWEDVETTANAVSLNSQSFRSQSVEEPEHDRPTRARRSLAGARGGDRGGMPKL